MSFCSFGYVHQVAVITKMGLVMKQSRRTYASVGNVNSIFTDKDLSLDGSTDMYMKPSLKRFAHCDIMASYRGCNV